MAELAHWLGSGSATVMLDLWKAFETVAPMVLLREAEALGYPMRLMAMLLKAYRQPRAIKAFGSFSKMVIAHQGNVAGCSHAATALVVLMTRAIKRAAAISPDIEIRLVVDDNTLQAAGKDQQTANELYQATYSYMSDLKELKMVVQPAKSGYVATSTVLVKFVEHSAQQSTSTMLSHAK